MTPGSRLPGRRVVGLLLRLREVDLKIEETLRQAAARRWPYAMSPWIHLGFVLAGLAWWGGAVIEYGTWETSPDANIAAGLGILWIAALGLPWSMLMFLDPYYYGLPEAGVVLILTTCAFLNVAVHARLMVRRHRRRNAAKSTSLHV